MDNELIQLEADLRALTPAAISEDLVEQIAARVEEDAAGEVLEDELLSLTPRAMSDVTKAAVLELVPEYRSEDSLEAELAALAPAPVRDDMAQRIGLVLAGREPAEPVRRSGLSLGMVAAAAVIVGVSVLAGALVLERHMATIAGFVQPADEPLPPPDIRPHEPVPTPPPAVAAIQYNPINAASLLVNEIDDGITVVDGVGPVKRVRYQTLERRQWESPDGRTFTITQPREQVAYFKLASY
jgi:hypothetical protein